MSLNKIGQENFYRNLAQLQVLDEPDSFKEAHKAKMKLVVWLATTAIALMTLEAIARELAMKLAGRY